jgi:cyclase
MVFNRLIPRIVVEWDQSRNTFVSILTRGFQHARKIGDPLSQIRILQSNLVDEIVLVNRTQFFSSNFYDLVDAVAKEISTPLSVGGAIDSLEQCKNLVSVGADKLIIGRNGNNNSLSKSISDMFGSQSTVFSFDYYTAPDQDMEEIATSVGNVVKKGGYGEVILNCISADGGKDGPHLELLSHLYDKIKVPILVGCGFSKISHFAEAYRQGARGVLTSTYLSNLDQSPKQVRSHLHALGVHIRVSN